VGGQGVITASGLLARAAIASGLDVKLYGSYGMAQRGGTVIAQIDVPNAYECCSACQCFL
jgi:indolepyruvate ferredoxin oxidoreductase beta subunit